MQDLQEHAIVDLVSPQVLSVLQFRAFSEPLLPNLKSFGLWTTRCDSIPFIPLFLSPRTTTISINFALSGADHSKAVIASMIATLPTLCPSLQQICFYSLPRDPMITSAVSKLLLTTNQNTLSYFFANSPLLEGAREVVYKLPCLGVLRTLITVPTVLPMVVLPSLTELDVEYDRNHDWLQGFCGASLGKLASLSIRSNSDTIGDVLGAFETVALTTSIPATLLTFNFLTSCSWRPNYCSLLPFTQLKELVIGFSCELGCSSTIDDDTITALARAMPKLETLRFGNPPCKTPAGVTTKGLSALAHYCLRLSELCVHFQVASFDPSQMPGFASSDDCTVPRDACALTDLNVGDTRMPKESALMVALTLTRIFPRLKWIEHTNTRGWQEVARAIGLSIELADSSSKKPTFAAPRLAVDDTSPGPRRAL